jgi:hypothetical protein
MFFHIYGMEKNRTMLNHITLKEYLIRRNFPELATINKKQFKKIEGKK